MVTQWYDPEVGSASLPASIARALHSQGHTVDVVTGFPNYPSGKLYPGYRVRPYQRESRDGITVHRAPLYPSHDSRAMHRAANFISFAAAGSGVGAVALRNVDATLVYSSPATACVPAMVGRTIRRTPYVLMIQDMWPQSVMASAFLPTAKAKRVEKALHRYCDAMYRMAASVTVTSPGMTELIAERGVDRRKIVVVPNWADESHFQPVEPRRDVTAEFAGLRPFTVMYAGNLGDVQGLEVVVEAADLLRDHREIGFVLVGEGVAEPMLRSQVHERHLDNVRFVAAQPVERMASVLALGDVQLVTLRHLPIFESTLPSKVQATLAAGRPIIGAVEGDAAEVIRLSGAGTVVPPGSPDELARAVLNASRAPATDLQEQGRRGREYYEHTMSQQSGTSRLIDLLQSAADGRSRR